MWASCCILNAINPSDRSFEPRLAATMNAQKINSLGMIVMAAGKGRRFGGLKQLEPFGPQGETLMDYALHDGLQAGFNHVVLVISPDCEAEFETRLVTRWRNRLDIVLAHQKSDDLPHLPQNHVCFSERSKPWGTGHALWTARNHMTTPFVVFNADDYYGPDAFAAMASFLHRNGETNTFAMQGYDLLATLPATGSFSRGLCQSSAEGWLETITEHPEVRRHEVTGTDQIASMNFWGFTPVVFSILEQQFSRFLDNYGQSPDQEFYLPTAIQAGLAADYCRVCVLPSLKTWFGVTHPDDRQLVSDQLRLLHQQGLYPKGFAG